MRIIHTNHPFSISVHFEQKQLVTKKGNRDNLQQEEPLSQRPLIGNGRDEDFADVCHTSVHLISVMLKLKSGPCAITAAHQIIHNGGRTHGRRRPSLRIANGGGGPELTSSTVLLTSNQQHTRLLTKSAAINKVLLMNQLPTSSPRSSSTKTTPSWQHEYFLINDQSLYFF